MELGKNLIKKYRPLLDKYGKMKYSKQISNYFEKIKGINIKKGAKILEIGAGKGLFSHFLGTYFDANVTSMDQYEGFGSPMESYSINKTINEELGYDNVKIVKKDFMNFMDTEKYDYIFAINVFHHIIDTSKRLSADNDNYSKCRDAFLKVYDLLNNNGLFVMGEVEKENYNINPLYYEQNKEVNFKTKQNNWEWRKVLRDVGFKGIKVRHLTPRIIREFPGSHYIFNIRAVSLFFDSSYVIVCRR